MNMKTSFDADEIKAFEPAEKIGIVASVNPDGLPHISLLTSLRAIGPARLTIGEFCKGLSKRYVQQNPKTAFLILTFDKRLWRGKAKWTHLRKDGTEFQMYNETPTFRYNPYFGVNTVHYFDLIEAFGGDVLPLSNITQAALITRIAKGGARTGEKERILKPVAEELFNKLASLKFLAYMSKDGYPVIIPVIQCQAADSRRLVYSPAAYRDELEAVPEGIPVAIFAVGMNMQSVLVRGTFAGFKRYRFFRLGVIDIHWVYNSMIPCHGQVYPEMPLEAVQDF